MEQDHIYKVITFYGTVSANSDATLCSPRIATPFSISSVSCSFALNQERKVKIKIYSSIDASEPTTGEPSGTNIFNEYGHVDYIVGDGDTKRFLHETPVLTGGSYLKVYADNTDSFKHTIDVQITIQIHPRR